MFFNKRKKEKRHRIVRFSDEKNAKIESDDIIRLIGYRFDATGVFGYSYYTTTDKVCSVSTIVAPSAPVMIHGRSTTWRSDFDKNCTICPGLTRSITDELSGIQIFRIVYKDRGEYEINDSITAYCFAGNYTFYWDAKAIVFSVWVDQSVRLNRSYRPLLQTNLSAVETSPS